MTILVTGAGGFIGRHLLDALRGRDTMVPLDLRPLDGYPRCVVNDLAGNPEHVRLVMRGVKPTLVFHLAGRIQGDPVDLWRTNVQGTVNLLEAVKAEAPSARVVVVGTAAEYGRPKGDEPLRETDQCHPRGAYGTSKHAAVLAALDQSVVDMVVARPFNLIGAGMGEHLAVGHMIARVRHALATGSRFAPGRGLDLRRDFLAVQDVAQALVALADKGKRGEVYNVCYGEPTAFRVLHSWLCEFSGLALEEEPARPGEIPLVVGDPSKLMRDTGWTASVHQRGALLQAWEASK